jgi:hypothetical protein
MNPPGATSISTRRPSRDSPSALTTTDHFLYPDDPFADSSEDYNVPKKQSETIVQSYRANSALNALSMCPQQPQWVVLAGREGTCFFQKKNYLYI